MSLAHLHYNLLFFSSLHIFACVFKKTIQNKMSGLVHPFHKVPMSVTTPDTGEKTMNKVSGSCFRVLAERVSVPRESHCRGYHSGVLSGPNACVPTPKSLVATLTPV